MKKLRLDLSSFEGKELLSRSQLRKITGGNFGTPPECGIICSITDREGNQTTEVWSGMTATEATFASCSSRDVSSCSCAVAYGGPECD